MNTQEVLNLSLTIAIIVITICVGFVSFYLVRALKSFTNLAENIDETASDIRSKLQLKFLTAIPALVLGLISKFKRKGGE